MSTSSTRMPGHSSRLERSRSCALEVGRTTKEAKAAESESSLRHLYPRGFWPALAFPGVVWIVALFLIPFFAIVATAAGRIDPVYGNSIPEWNPIYWHPTNISWVLHDPDGIVWPTFVRTIGYVLSAVLLCIVLGFPVAYYITRLSGRMRAVFLVLVVLPFWVSYLMRMFAWVNLLQPDGLINRFLSFTHLMGPQEWLSGRASTVVLGLAYGYIPFFILPLYAALERIDKNIVQAALDLGASPARAFARVTLPLSKNGLIAGTAIIMLPMFGDFYTVHLLGTPKNAMTGTLVALYLTTFTQGASQGRGAALVVVLTVFVSTLTVYYLIETFRAGRAAGR
jgi:putrescine transport system permease protein